MSFDKVLTKVFGSSNERFLKAIKPTIVQINEWEPEIQALSDDELRVIWPLLAEAGTFGAMLKTLLLSAQRRDEVANMTWKEIGGDQIWTIPAERYKTKGPNFVPLPEKALAIIEAQPKIEKCDYVFPSGTKTPFSGFAKSKAAFDKAVQQALQKQARAGETAEPLPNWTLHDLRRTFSTNLAKLGVAPHIKEALLNHIAAKSEVEAIYDHYAYLPEKRQAIERWEAHLTGLLHQRPQALAA